MARGDKMSAVLDLRGLDLVTPVDLLSNGHTPFSKNFRLYAQQTDDRRVAVSSRKGPGFYTTPLGETLSASNTASTGASTAKVGISTGIHMQPFTAPSNDRITRIDISVKNVTSASGPLMVKIYDTLDGKPHSLLAESSVLSGDIGATAAYETARFLKSPKMTATNTYWIVLQVQDDGKGEYDVTTTTAGTKTYATDSSLYGGTEQTYGLNFKVYTAPDLIDKGSYRFARDNGVNVTLVAYGTTMYKVNPGDGSLTSIATGLSALATEYSFANGDNKVFWVNGYDQLKAWNGTTVETITDPELPILSQVVMHKDRLWGVVASDPNKLVFSENPGNPAFDSTGTIPTTATQQWYYAWLSVSFIYVPRPHNGSPITGLVSFQDSLTVFTQDKKYVISGYDRGSFFLREATGVRGALSARGIASDENRIYFASGDGLYEYNGSEDSKLSTLISPLFDGCSQKEKITPVIWKNQVRFYMASNGSPVNDSCVIYEKDLKEIVYDTDTWINRAIYYGDADDDQQLIEFSSLTQTAFLAEQGYSSLGAPIDFEYRLKYDSMGAPAQRKRIKKFYPLLQGVDSTFPLTLAIDKDFEDSPRTRDILMVTNGAKWGQFYFDDGTLFGSDTSFKMHKQSISGYANYFQMRILRKAVNNRVAFIGAQFSYKTKRL